jgi:hypothetical protein
MSRGERRDGYSKLIGTECIKCECGDDDKRLIVSTTMAIISSSASMQWAQGWLYSKQNRTAYSTGICQHVQTEK